MRIALYSDLHLETSSQSWKPPALDADVVVLAGDIGSHTHGIAWAGQAFHQAPVSPAIVYVAGNHEYYGAQLGLIADLERAGKRHGVHFLENSTLELSGVRILGSTLWSAFDLYGAVDASMAICRHRINDFNLIRNHAGRRLDPQDALDLHRQAVVWLDAELAKPFNGKTVVVTHFGPHPGTIAPQHQGGDVSPYFVTDLSWLMAKHRIDVWCYGHSHTNSDFVAENGCRVISNQRGYPFERDGIGFREDWVIEL